MSDQTVNVHAKVRTIEIPINEKDALVSHIESLQAVITKRNERIEELEKELETYKTSPMSLINSIRDEAFNAGYNWCARGLHDTLQDLADLTSEDRRIK